MYQTVGYDIVKSMLPMTIRWGMETARNVAVIDLGMSFYGNQLWSGLLLVWSE